MRDPTSVCEGEEEMEKVEWKFPHMQERTPHTHLVHKVLVADVVHALVQEGSRLVGRQPALAVLHLLLAECHLNGTAILLVC